MKKFSIEIIDDQRLFSEVLRELLSTFSFIDEVRLSNPPDNKLFKLPPHSVDLFIIDLLMPFINGFEVVEQIRAVRPEQKIAILSSKQDSLSLKKARQLGVQAYLFKNSPKDQLRYAMYQVLIRNKIYFSQPETYGDIYSFSDGKKIKITIRELQFAELLLEELSGNEIAKVMNVSPHTVTGYRKNLFKKFGVNNMIGLAKYVLQILP